MPKKKSTPPPQPEPKKPQVLALRKTPSTPEPDAEVINNAPTTPVALPDPPVVSVSESTPGVEAEVKLDAQPSAEPKKPGVEAEVKLDAPITPTAKPNRPVLKKKSDRVGNGETSSEASTTPDLLESPPDGAIFQGVGVIVGDVTFTEGKATVAIGEKAFPLYYAPQKKKAYYALEQQVKANGSRQRLMVYPRVTHFPKREEPHRIAFQLVGFFRTDRDANSEEITTELGDFEFKLSGLWQFIPVCSTPCVTILKNYTEERKEFIKEADLALKVKFMKASHLPVVWRDAPVRPFRFNPKAPKENQGNPAFVQLKAAFVPETELFQVLALTSTPAVKAPRFLKARKEDKLRVASDKLKAARGDRKKK
jgi:hypothetical protein